MQFATPAEREAFILANQGIVHTVVRGANLKCVSEDDAVSVGMLALIDAVDKFDPLRGFQFSTYAYRAVRSMVYHEVNETTYIGRVPPGAIRYAAWQASGKPISREQEKCVNAYKRSNSMACEMHEDVDKAERPAGYWERVERQCREVVIATSELDEVAKPIMMERLGINQGCQVQSWTEVARATGRNRNSLKVQMRGTLEYLRDRVASVA